MKWRVLLSVLLALVGAEIVLLYYGYGYDYHYLNCEPTGYLPAVMRRIPSVENDQVLENIDIDHTRICHPYVLAKRPYRVLCVGCSYTFGLGCSEDETFVWRLNEMFPQVIFDNGGVSGFGTLQSYIRMQQLMKRRHYDAVLYCMIDGHILRNGPRVRQDRGGLMALPWASLVPSESDAGLRKLDYGWAHQICWWGDNLLRTVNFAKLFYYKCLHRHFRYCGNTELVNVYPSEGYKLLRELVDRMRLRAKQEGAGFGVVCLDDSFDRMHKYGVAGPDSAYPPLPIAQAGFPHDFIALGFNTCSPHHSGEHPNGLIHDYYARRIAKWLQRKHMLPPEALVRSEFDRRQHPFPEALKPYVDPLDYRDE